MLKHKDRFFVRFLREYCAKKQIRLISIPGSWIFILQSGSKQHLIMGYDLGLNSSVAAKVCNEKTATYSVLSAVGIPSIPHYLFLPPAKRQFVEGFGTGNWAEMISLHNSFGGTTVVKQDNGTGGQNVFLAKNLDQLESSSMRIFSQNNNVALSPFSSLLREVRFIIHRSEILLCHEYLRPHLVGDGKSSVDQLLSTNQTLAKFSADAGVDVNFVPPKGWIYRLGFQRDVPGTRIVPVKVRLVSEARELAVSAFAQLGLTFGSIDVVLTEKEEWKILEAHSGVMLEGPFRSGKITENALIAAYSTALDSVGFA